MSYTPTTWQTGDTITAEKLNNMSAFVVNVTFDGATNMFICDKTGAEVYAAFQKVPVYFKAVIADGQYTTENLTSIVSVAKSLDETGTHYWVDVYDSGSFNSTNDGYLIRQISVDV